MKARRSLAMAAVGSIAAVSVVAGVDMFRSNDNVTASDPTSGRAQLAVNSQRAKDKAATKPLTVEEQAAEVVRLRNQIEQIETAKRRSQDKAAIRGKARRAAVKRYAALYDAKEDSRRERASRDAERRKYEGTPKEVARNLLADHGWPLSQFRCLDKLWTRESRWRVDADNPTSSAYGIPQALPGRRMAEYGKDWRTNPVTQIRWGLDYIQDAHGSPCEAWAHSERKGWY
ncbi:aggregation-promoting factor C-terminal-like domain-containing protein [Kribbella deserti]|uniref:Lytic transglycosylase domain-containing protein n=1 Tax=Kribbella deserti TaxID=1926257 RepID=A0ABV6QMT0_9ACTN